MLEKVFRECGNYDIIHFHLDYLHFPFSRRTNCRHVTTLHGRLDLPELPALYREYADVPVIAISNTQRSQLPMANWQGTVYHGLPADLHTFRKEPGKYLAFLGRISPEKGVNQAIEIAARSGVPLKIAAKVSKQDEDYYRQEIEPLLQHLSSLVEFVGEVGGKQKDEFLGNACALLFPISWPEPFGLVMIEAMACGTPVIAFPCGSVPEIMREGATGFVVSSVGEAVKAVDRIRTLDRSRCRQVFADHYTATRMADDYVRIYRRLASEESTIPERTPATPKGRDSTKRASVSAAAFAGSIGSTKPQAPVSGSRVPKQSVAHASGSE
jgi:glycosyltransferase involved in cell wall biosynthesis